MENASKALIIAGAILLSILLISLGIVVFNQAKDVASGSGMTQSEVQAFNAKFTQYEGKQKGSAIRSMVQEVLANNNGSEASDETMVSINVVNPFAKDIALDADADAANTVTLDAGENKTPSYKTNFKNTKTYYVTPKYKNGRVVLLEVKLAS